MEHKVLMIAYSYPPRHAIGALRSAKFAKYLPQYGWEPIVVSRFWNDEIHNLDEPEGIKVIRTHFQDRLRYFRRNRSKNATQISQVIQSAEGWRSTVRKMGSFWLKEFLAYPDEAIGWKPHALEAARKILHHENISLIFSTSAPSTSHLIARELQRETGLPWVADFRDLWTQNHYACHTPPRRWIETKLEIKTLKDASVLITVSQPDAEKLQRLHGKPMEVITNGFDEDDYSAPPPPLTPYFSLTYTGSIYAGKRDPSLLFAAVKELLERGTIDPERFLIRFYGRDGVLVEKMAASFGVRKVVRYEGLVSYRETVQRQRESTALLLLNWESPEEKGVYTGKVFEYLGARRPILAIPRNGGVVDELMRETKAGVVAGTREEIAKILNDWYWQFNQRGSLRYYADETAVQQYTRRNQAKKLADLFHLTLKQGVEA